MASFSIQLEDGHVRHGTTDKGEHEDGGDGDVDVHGGLTAQGGDLWGVRWAWRHRGVLGLLLVWGKERFDDDEVHTLPAIIDVVVMMAVGRQWGLEARGVVVLPKSVRYSAKW